MNNNPQFSRSYSNLTNGYYNYPANQWYHQPVPYNITPNGNVPSLVTLGNSSTTTTNSKNSNNNPNSSVNAIQPTAATQPPPPYTIYPSNTQHSDTRAHSAPPPNYYQSLSLSLPPSTQFSPSNFSPPSVNPSFPTSPTNQCPPINLSPPPPYNQCSPPGFSPPFYNQCPPTSFSPPPALPNQYPSPNVQHSSSNGNISNCSAPPSPTHTPYPPSPTHYCPYPYGYPSLINHFATYRPPPPLDYIPKYIDDQWKERICKFLDLPYDPRANTNNNPILKGGYFGTVYSVASDGNCFFRCISQELTGQQTYHSKLRAKLCEFIENHREKFEAYVDCSFSKHLRRMKRDSTWATHAEIFGMATLLGCSIYVNTKYGFTTEWLQHDPVFQYHTPLPGYHQQPALGKIYVIHIGEVHFNLFVV